MMAKKKYDLAVVVGEYTNRDGETRRRYQNVGAVMVNDDGKPFLMLAKWFNPAGVKDDRGGESILINCFEPQPRNEQPALPQSKTKSADAYDQLDDDIPF